MVYPFRVTDGDDPVETWRARSAVMASIAVG